MPDETFLILGGAGLVGLQIARRIAHDLTPKRIIIASLFQQEVNEAIHGPAGLRRMFPHSGIEFAGVWGDVFVRAEFSEEKRSRLLESYQRRDDLYADLFGDFDAAFDRSRLVQLILEHKPDVIVDSINTATAISYQDVYTGTVIAKRELDDLLTHVRAGDAAAAKHEWKDAERAFETLLISHSVPQLIRHVLMINRAMREVGTRLYLKIGTTGTGGMGLNIPYTHSEDRPSAKLMTKTAIAFAHTGLLFLMARTVGGPVVKEIKPGAMIGFADISLRTIREAGRAVTVYAPQTFPIESRLPLRLPAESFESLGDLSLPVVDTGENGVFTKGEFETITSLRQMEFITPEEIALDCVLEIKGSNTGRDVIAAIDGAVMNPTYRAGVLRQQALNDIERLEAQTGLHSVALGQLGPPEISKLLWEAELLQVEYGTLKAVLAQTPEAISEALFRRLQVDAALRQTITSIGAPILTPDGTQLMRGPFIRIPEVAGATTAEIGPGDLDKWAAKGWVDLRPANFARWQKRFEMMERSRQALRGKGSAAVTREAYLFDEIRIGALVGWIFNNEQEGYRIK
ncbi:MAG: hypothetical protein HYZ49_08435 [Chloroflexi bacterium]|nr:hypothetical protein [Chloroflexota bacterium]